MPFIRTATGLVLPDDFDRSNNNTVGNGWTEPLISESAAAMKILNNQLRCDIGVAGIGRSSPALPNDMIMQINIETGNSIVFVNMGFRTNILAVGAGSEDSYGVILNESAATLLINETISGAGNTRDTQSAVYDNKKFGMRAITEVSGGDLIIRSGLTAPLSDLEDLTEDFDGVVGSFTDTVSPFTHGEYFIFSNTAPTDFDKFRLCGRNIVINTMPSGWKSSIDGGTTKVVESGGTVTHDVDTLALPRTDVRVYNPFDVLKDVFSEDLWGGDAFNFRVYPKDAMITGVSR